MNGNVQDYSGNARHATLDGPQPADDALGESGNAYRFTASSDIIFLPNETALNFRDKITVAFWIKLDAITEESFVLSHGSWEERWKISVTPGKNLRWTIKNSSGTQDLDSTFPLVLGMFYHFTAVYSGYSMELYVDGELDNFQSNNGQLSITSKDLTFGRKDTGTTDYSLHGSLDEVRIYDEALSPDEIKTLRLLWNNNVTGVQNQVHETISVYPNPSSGVINISGPGILNIEVWDLQGVKIHARISADSGPLIQVDCNPAMGIMILKIETLQGIFYKKIVKY
jgi:hypothetical protein